jgi:hypothetical protein
LHSFYRLLMVIPAAFMMAPAVAPVPQFRDAAQTMLVTLFKGDLGKTKTTFETVSTRYKEFLNHFMGDGYCEQSEEILSGCMDIREKELILIQQKTWSHGFKFTRAEFNRNLGIYNLEKEQTVTNDFRCVFTLQITADLHSQEVMNKEFYVLCGDQLKDRR